jgi:hypothetical protein
MANLRAAATPGQSSNRKRFIVSAVFLLGSMGVAWAITPWIGAYEGLSYGGLMLVALVSGLSFMIPGPSIAGVLVGGATLNPWLVGLCMGVGTAITMITFLKLRGMVGSQAVSLWSSLVPPEAGITPP